MLKILNILIGIVFIFYITSYFDVNFREFSENITSFNPYLIILSIFAYVLSHSFRVFRLLLFTDNHEFSIFKLYKEQFKANGLNLIVPFKLGEAYRFLIFKNFFNGYSNSFVIILIEKILDILTIFLLLGLTFLFSELIFFDIFTYLFILILILFISFFVFNDIVKLIHKIYLKKESSETYIKIVKLTANYLKVSSKIKKIISRNIGSLITISMIIWVLEISSFYFLIDVLNNNIPALVILAASVFLSSLLPNGPLGYGGIQLAFYSIGLILSIENLIDFSIVYSFVIFGVGALIAGVLFIKDSIFTKYEKFR